MVGGRELAGVAAALAVVAAGCNASVDGMGSGSDASATDPAIEAFLAAYCDLFRPCCAAAGYRTDGEVCRAYFRAYLSHLTYDAAGGETCIREIKAATSDVCGGERALPRSCDFVVHRADARQRPGEACDDSSGCARSDEGPVACALQSAGAAYVRKCQIQLHGKVGDQPCVGTLKGGSTLYPASKLTDVPARGYLCEMEEGLRCGDTGACEPLKAVGQPCLTYPPECAQGAYCDGKTHTCLALHPIGSACGDAAAYSSAECGEGAFCSESNLCTAVLADRAACTASKQCGRHLCVNAKCDVSAVGNAAFVFVCGFK